MNGLAVAEPEDECPANVAPALWPLLRRTLVLMKTGVDKRSANAVAAEFGLTEPQLTAIRRAKVWRLDIERERENLSEASMIAAGTMLSSLHEDIRNPEVLAEMSVRDKAVVAKQMSENALNLGNGMVGSPALNMSFGDVKILLGAGPAKPGE